MRSRASSIEAAQRNFVFRYRSPEHWLEDFRTYYDRWSRRTSRSNRRRNAAVALRSLKEGHSVEEFAIGKKGGKRAGVAAKKSSTKKGRKSAPKKRTRKIAVAKERA